MRKLLPAAAVLLTALAPAPARADLIDFGTFTASPGANNIFATSPAPPSAAPGFGLFSPIFPPNGVPGTFQFSASAVAAGAPAGQISSLLLLSTTFVNANGATFDGTDFHQSTGTGSLQVMRNSDGKTLVGLDGTFAGGTLGTLVGHGSTALLSGQSVSGDHFNVTSDLFSAPPGTYSLNFDLTNITPALSLNKSNGNLSDFTAHDPVTFASDTTLVFPSAGGAAVPEPSTFALLALGGGALAGWCRWRRRRTA
jgi:hypothetical protein